MREFIRILLFGLIPPNHPYGVNGPPTKEDLLEYRNAKTSWYRSVAATLWVIMLTGGGFVLWSVGVLPRTTGFAYAEDVHSDVLRVVSEVSGIEETLDGLMMNQLESRLMENRRQQCVAIHDNDAERKKTYSQIMQELKQQHQEQQKAEWPEPNCDAL